LAIATIALGVRVGLDWRATSSSSVDAMANKQVELRMLQLQTAPLRGLDKKVALSHEQIDEFYAKRIPPSYSSIAERLGQIKARGPVNLTTLQYTQAKGSGDLIEIRMNAGVSGDYPAIMRFVNGLERSETFFVIRAMALNGQQSGIVNLRLEVSTWLRPADAVGIPVEGDRSATPAATGSPADDIVPTSPTALLRQSTPGNVALAGEGQ
jgi:hypothetical protein